MSGQYSLTSNQIVKIRDILNAHNIPIVAETTTMTTDNGKEHILTIFNNISIKVADEDGEQWFIQVN